MGKLMNELRRLVEADEEEDAVEDDTADTDTIEPDSEEDVAEDEDDEEQPSTADIGEIVKHISAVERAVDYIDGLTPEEGEGTTVAFEAEIALRKAIDRMRKLSDSVYKNKD